MAYIIVMNGLIMLKKQKGKYVSVETPNTLACVAPHVFHGINTDVTVPESSSVLLKFSGAKSFFLYVSVNIFPGTIIDKY